MEGVEGKKRSHAREGFLLLPKSFCKSKRVNMVYNRVDATGMPTKSLVVILRKDYRERPSCARR